MELPVPIKTLELDKICRVCLTVKKDMRPLFGEMIADMLMECARIQVHIVDISSRRAKTNTFIHFACESGSLLLLLRYLSSLYVDVYIIHRS